LRRPSQTKSFDALSLGGAGKIAEIDETYIDAKEKANIIPNANVMTDEARASAAQIDFVCIVHYMIQDGIRQCWIAHRLMPVGNR
jgi:precorrin-6B methylase 2